MIAKHVTLAVPLAYPLLPRILFSQDAATILVALADVTVKMIMMMALNVVHQHVNLVVISRGNAFNVKETDFMLRMVLPQVPVYHKLNALKII